MLSRARPFLHSPASPHIGIVPEHVGLPAYVRRSGQAPRQDRSKMSAQIRDIGFQYLTQAMGLRERVHEGQGAPAAGWRRLQAMQTMDVTVCGSSR